MARLKISEAAKLVGLNRKTLYKHIKQGKVSSGVDSLGAKYIDAAELHRAYGDFPITDDTDDTPETATLETVVRELRQLRETHNQVLDELKALRQQVANGLLLEHKPSQHDEKPENTQKHSFSALIQKIKESSA